MQTQPSLLDNATNKYQISSAGSYGSLIEGHLQAIVCTMVHTDKFV